MAETEQKDLFRRQRSYPDAAGLISWSSQSLGDVRDSAMVVVDTNALLVPFGIGKASLEEIGKTYRSLINRNRLTIPGQVVREFASNRVTKLQELHQQLARKNVGFSRDAYPLLEGLTGYTEMKALEGQLEELVRSYKKAVYSVLTEIRTWRWNDPVSVLYADLFKSEVIQDPQFDEADLADDLEKRKKSGTPPGYKDTGKEDGGMGDLIIWRTILTIGKNRRVPLLFVSGDQKPDWWHQSEGRPLYPRFELVDEYRRQSGGQTLHLLTFSDFLDLFGANPVIVEEVRKEEQEVIRRSVNESRTLATDTPPAAPQISPDELRRVQEALRPLISQDGWRSMQEALRPSQQEGWLSMQEALRPSQDALRSMQEAVRPSQDALRSMQEAMRPSLEALRSMQEAVRPSQDALRSMQEAMRPSLEALRSMQEAMRPSEEAWRSPQESHRPPQFPPEEVPLMDEPKRPRPEMGGGEERVPDQPDDAAKDQ